MQRPTKAQLAGAAGAAWLCLVFVAIATYDPYRDLGPRRTQQLKMDQSVETAIRERSRTAPTATQSYPTQQEAPWGKNRERNWREDPPKNYHW